ncbi:MAG TPA: universal stress protein [Steroidobacteraceae bacterium]|nr:universal stress protein [Steroidobacteraceae bacterium]
MALKDVLVWLDQTNRSSTHLRLAADLARRHGSYMTALYVREWNPAQLAHRRTAELAGRPLADVERLNHTVEAALDDSAVKAQAEVASIAAEYGIAIDWRVADGEANRVLPQYARYADLCVLDAEIPAASTSAGYRFSEEMLFVAGRPVLLVPRTSGRATLGGHVAVAWNSSRAAARAINDALPLLERSERATVIAVNPADFIGQHDSLPLKNLLEHLQRHGISAHCVELTGVPPAEIADTLQQRARAEGADLLVAGAHGHMWLRDVLLGSVTRDLLSRLRLPVMMSH